MPCFTKIFDWFENETTNENESTNHISNKYHLNTNCISWPQSYINGLQLLID